MIVKSFREAADRRLDAMEEQVTSPAPAREPLTAQQHILHLLLTVFTGGLWAPVWFVRAWHGNAKG